MSGNTQFVIENGAKVLGNSNTFGDQHISGNLVVSGSLSTLGSVSTNVIPFAGNTYFVGNSSVRWAGLFTQNVDVSGTLTVTGTANIAGATMTNPGYLDQTIADSNTINWDANLGSIATITLGANTGVRIINNPTNLKKGSYILYLIQDGTGTRTVSWGTNFKWPLGAVPALSTAAGSRDVFSFVSNGSFMDGSFMKGMG